MQIKDITGNFKEDQNQIENTVIKYFEDIFNNLEGSILNVKRKILRNIP